MAVAAEFRREVVRLGSEESVGEELFPTVWARACVAVLPVAGAGLSITRDLRVPLGASDEMAAVAERLQTTLGEGPCLAALDELEPVVVEMDEMATRWPLFATELSRRTSFRSIVSVPLIWGIPARRVGALDLYLTDSQPPSFLADDGSEVVEVIIELLFASTATVEYDGSVLPVWMSGESAGRRLNVWLAVGMLIGHAGMGSSDALATLRGYAYGVGHSLDDVAKALIERQIGLHTVLTSD